MTAEIAFLFSPELCSALASAVYCGWPALPDRWSEARLAPMTFTTVLLLVLLGGGVDGGTPMAFDAP